MDGIKPPRARMKLRIAHKGLLLVLVPLVLELVLFTSLLDLLKQAEETARVALRSREILASINGLTSDVVQLYKTFNDEKRAREVKPEDVDRMKKDLERDMFSVSEQVKD